jgi:hypothetical protein
MADDLGLETQVRKVLTPALLPFGRFARRRPTRPSSKVPGECGRISRSDHKKNCPKDTSPTSPKDTSPKDTSPKDTGHLIAVAAPETVL